MRKSSGAPESIRAIFFSDPFGATIEDDRDSSKNKPRREPRFPVDTRVTVNRAEPSVSGQAIEISQSGIAILAAADLRLGEVVELQFKLRQNLMCLRAVVRKKETVPGMGWSF